MWGVLPSGCRPRSPFWPTAPDYLPFVEQAPRLFAELDTDLGYFEPEDAGRCLSPDRVAAAQLRRPSIHRQVEASLRVTTVALPGLGNRLEQVAGGLLIAEINGGFGLLHGLCKFALADTDLRQDALHPPVLAPRCQIGELSAFPRLRQVAVGVRLQQDPGTQEKRGRVGAIALQGLSHVLQRFRPA